MWKHDVVSKSAQNAARVETEKTLEKLQVGKDIRAEVVEERPEFNCGTVDFIANHEYMNRPPMPPIYIFALDVSKPAVDCGYL